MLLHPIAGFLQKRTILPILRRALTGSAEGVFIDSFLLNVYHVLDALRDCHAVYAGTRRFDLRSPSYELFPKVVFLLTHAKLESIPDARNPGHDVLLQYLTYHNHSHIPGKDGTLNQSLLVPRRGFIFVKSDCFMLLRALFASPCCSWLIGRARVRVRWTHQGWRGRLGGGRSPGANLARTERLLVWKRRGARTGSPGGLAGKGYALMTKCLVTMGEPAYS